MFHSLYTLCGDTALQSSNHFEVRMVVAKDHAASCVLASLGHLIGDGRVVIVTALAVVVAYDEGVLDAIGIAWDDA